MDNYDPDRLPPIENSLLSTLDGVVLEMTLLHGRTPLEASFLALLMNVEGLAYALMDIWKEQGRQEAVYLSSATIEGMLETVKWGRVKAQTLIDERA